MNIQKMKLPTDYESIRAELASTDDEYISKLMEFVRPVENAERELTEISAQMGSASGKTVFLLGKPGTGKSTFIQSLIWRTHLSFAHLEQINCSEFEGDILDSLLSKLREVSQINLYGTSNKQYVAVAINYLEDFKGLAEGDIKAFFRTLNGILRNKPLFIIWPVTERDEAEQMLKYAESVSGTVFQRGKEIVEFTGPETKQYKGIAKNTISVINDGKTIEDFGLTDADLDELHSEIVNDPHHPVTIRRFLESVNTRWSDRNNYIQKLHASIPKPFEVWFIVAYPEAEDVVVQFSRRGDSIDSAWGALHSKLWEYIPNSQRKAEWDAKRLQLALNGAFVTRIMYLPTNALVSTIAAYADKSEIDISSKVPPRWLKQSAAREQLRSSPLLRQLKQERVPPGKRKSGPAAQAKIDAKDGFEDIVKFVTGSGRDTHINRALSMALSEELGDDYNIVPEKPHPWLSSIYPDIRVDLPSNRHVCLEFHYTSRTEPNILADYILRKLNTYMNQLEHIIKK